MLSARLPERCHDPCHPNSAEGGRAWQRRIARKARAAFGGYSSESGCDHFAAELDNVLYQSPYPGWDAPKTSLVDGTLPLWSIVYNGIILSNPFYGTIDAGISHVAGDPPCAAVVRIACGPSARQVVRTETRTVPLTPQGDGALRFALRPEAIPPDAVWIDVVPPFMTARRPWLLDGRARRLGRVHAGRGPESLVALADAAFRRLARRRPLGRAREVLALRLRSRRLGQGRPL